MLGGVRLTGDFPIHVADGLELVLAVRAVDHAVADLVRTDAALVA